jgi:hypothetical protein
MGSNKEDKDKGVRRKRGAIGSGIKIRVKTGLGKTFGGLRSIRMTLSRM